MWRYNNSDELYHYGVLGMRWHHRKRLKEYDKEYEKGANKILNSGKSMSEINRELTKFGKKLDKKYADSLKYKKEKDSKKWSTKKKILVGSGIAIGIVGAAIGAKKIKDYLADKKKINLGKSATTYSINRFNDTQPWNRTDIAGRRIVKVTSKSQIPKSAIKFDRNNHDHVYSLMFGK